MVLNFNQKTNNLLSAFLYIISSYFGGTGYINIQITSHMCHTVKVSLRIESEPCDSRHLE